MEQRHKRRLQQAEEQLRRLRAEIQHMRMSKCARLPSPAHPPRPDLPLVARTSRQGPYSGAALCSGTSAPAENSPALVIDVLVHTQMRCFLLSRHEKYMYAKLRLTVARLQYGPDPDPLFRRPRAVLTRARVCPQFHE